MPRIVEEVHYDGARERIERLGLIPLIDEIKAVITGFELLVLEKIDGNGGAAVGKLLDARFELAGGWTKKVSGDIDWVKCKQIDGTSIGVGVVLAFEHEGPGPALKKQPKRRSKKPRIGPRRGTQN
jgi:hypothetical protein